MPVIGKYNRLRVSRSTDFGLFLSDGDSDVLLPRKHVPPGTGIGDEIEVFVYTDSEDRIVATTKTPRLVVGGIAKLRCIAATKIGAFLDWGLEKDLLVPFAHQRERMKVGGDYVVSALYDTLSGRIIGSNCFDKLFREDPSGLEPGAKVPLLVYDTIPVGYLVIIDQKYTGIVYADETYRKIRVGDRLEGYVSKVRPDGRVDIRLRAPGRTGVLAESDRIIKALEKADGFLPLTAKTPPTEIEHRFGMSKRMYKEIISSLYKQRIISIGEDGIRLNGTAQE